MKPPTSDLCCTPCLEVVADRRCEAHITTAETEDVVWQLQLLQETLYVVEHLVQALV